MPGFMTEDRTPCQILADLMDAQYEDTGAEQRKPMAPQHQHRHIYAQSRSVSELRLRLLDIPYPPAGED